MRIAPAFYLCALLAVVACAGAPAVTPPSPTVPPVGTTVATAAATPSPLPSASTSPTPTRVDLSGIDACALIDQQMVQELTGTSLNFLGADESDDGRQRGCFYGATTPRPPYVELLITARPNGLAGSKGVPGNWECTTQAVDGLGAEAIGGTCLGSSQQKVFLTAWADGVAVTLIVNEPERPLGPEDLAAAYMSVIEQI